MNIIGRQIQLDDKRSVFVGRSDDDDGLTYVKFTNSDGEETRLKISQEAREALLNLLASDGIFVRDGESRWLAVYGESENRP